jgi:hypothetical protein
VNAHDFEKLFTDVHEEAVRVVARKFGIPRDTLATDAVQEAAVYCLEHLDRFQTIKKSYFLQLATSRAKTSSRPKGASTTGFNPSAQGRPGRSGGRGCRGGLRVAHPSFTIRFHLGENVPGGGMMDYPGDAT